MVRHIPSKVVTAPSFLQRNAPRESFVILCLLIVSPQSLFHRLAGGFCTMAMKWFLAAFLVCCLEFHTLHIWGDKFDCNSAPIHPTWGLGGRCGKPCWGPQVGLMGHFSMSFSDQRIQCGVAWCCLIDRPCVLCTGNPIDVFLIFPYNAEDLTCRLVGCRKLSWTRSGWLSPRSARW